MHHSFRSNLIERELGKAAAHGINTEHLRRALFPEDSSIINSQVYDRILEDLQSRYAPGSYHLNLTDDLVRIESSQDDPSDFLEAFKPWKKGPFQVGATMIDAEWRSDIKWRRIKPFLKNVDGGKVADIGCHNGFFMFQLLSMQPEFVLGLDPVWKHFVCFQGLNYLLGENRLCFLPVGVNDLVDCSQVFDSILCLGILYHHTDPISILRLLHRSLSTGGELLLDCQGLGEEGSACLVPGSRYAGAKGIWWLPSEATLHTWLKRTGFREIETIYKGKLTTEEQRPTSWAEVKSLGDFLDKGNPDLTVEGWPAPWRIYVRAVR